MFGFLAIVVISVETGSGGELGLAARLILLGVIADGLDGVLARISTSSEIGELLDSLADIVSFGVAPGLFVYTVARTEWGWSSIPDPTERVVLTIAITTAFVVAALLRTTMYMVYESDEFRPGVPNTLAATVLTLTYLAGFDSATLLLVEAAALTYLMLAQIPYPGLCARDALGVGTVQTVVIAWGSSGQWLARVLLVVALAYLTLGPISYRSRGIRK